jgi:endoribonuclease Dicer
MSYLINEHFGERLSEPISRALTASKRKANMDDFREGRLVLLVTTNALEEGIDVSNCLFVIRFDGFHTTKSHIQGSGRARYEGAEIYYFENSIAKEEAKAREMRQVAVDATLVLTAEQMEEGLVAGRDLRALGGALYPIVHPVSKCEVTMSNCIPLFNEYFQQVMKQSPPQNFIFVYETEEIRKFPPEIVKTLCSVTYPSPHGFQIVLKAEVLCCCCWCCLFVCLFPYCIANFVG